VDPRSPAPLAPPLDALGGDFPHLRAARERTAAGLRAFAATLERVNLPPETAVVLFGSWGRAEVTPGSESAEGTSTSATT
jgi:hypothetical protein